MTTSGTSTYSETKLEIIQEAFDILTICGEGMTISSFDMTRASNALNKMLKAWSNKSKHLWAKVEGVLFLTQYQNKYSVGQTGTAYATKLDDVVRTQLNGNHLASATTITVDSTTGMTVGDYIGIVLTDKSIYWTTILTLPTSTTLTITSGLTGAAADNNIVYTFTTKLTKPLKIKNLRIVNGVDNGLTSTLVEIPIELVAYDDYMLLPVKTTNNPHITIGAFNPNRVTGDIYVFPRPSDCSYSVYFSYERSIEDIINTGDEVDLPSEWLECITWQLALRLASRHGRSAALSFIAPMASKMLEDLLMWDAENDYIDVGVDICN